VFAGDLLGGGRLVGRGLRLCPILLLPARARLFILLLRRFVGGFELLKIVGRQALGVVDLLHPPVLVLRAFERHACLFQHFRTDRGLDFLKHGPGRGSLRGGGAHAQ